MVLLSYLHDNQNAWELQANGEWQKAAVVGQAAVHNAQMYLVEQKQLNV